MYPPRNVGLDLTTNDHDPITFQNAVRVVLKPFLQDALLMVSLERQPLVLRELVIRPDAEHSHVILSFVYPRPI